jgi:hypothetical protein
MSYYRLYFLDSSNRIREALDMEQPDDRGAIAAAAARAADGRAMELWNYDRVVRRFEAGERAS